MSVLGRSAVCIFIKAKVISDTWRPKIWKANENSWLTRWRNYAGHDVPAIVGFCEVIFSLCVGTRFSSKMFAAYRPVSTVTRHVYPSCVIDIRKFVWGLPTCKFTFVVSFATRTISRMHLRYCSLREATETKAAGC